MKTLAAILLSACVGLALAQAQPEEKKDAEKPKPEAKTEPKPDDTVVEIKRSGPPECYPKPVMTDAEIEVCKRARERLNQKK